MSQQTFAEMSEAEFDTLIDNYIEREAAGYGEMPTEVFSTCYWNAVLHEPGNHLMWSSSHAKRSRYPRQVD